MGGKGDPKPYPIQRDYRNNTNNAIHLQETKSIKSSLHQNLTGRSKDKEEIVPESESAGKSHGDKNDVIPIKGKKSVKLSRRKKSRGKSKVKKQMTLESDSESKSSESGSDTIPVKGTKSAKSSHHKKSKGRSRVREQLTPESESDDKSRGKRRSKSNRKRSNSRRKDRQRSESEDESSDSTHSEEFREKSDRLKRKKSKSIYSKIVDGLLGEKSSSDSESEESQAKELTPPSSVDVGRGDMSVVQTEITNFSQDSFEKYEKKSMIPVAFGGRGFFRPSSRQISSPATPEKDEYTTIGNVMSFKKGRSKVGRKTTRNKSVRESRGDDNSTATDGSEDYSDSSRDECTEYTGYTGYTEDKSQYTRRKSRY